MNPLINILHLKYFCDAVTLKSVSEAAKKNFVTQSTISQAIAKLETIIGAQIVTHARQSFQVTEEGMIVYEQASHIFKAISNMQEKIHETREEITGTVHFVCTHSLGMSFIAPAYKQMQINFPQVNLKFTLGSLEYIRNALQQRQAEFAIVLDDPDFSQFNKHVLKKGSFNLYRSVDTPPELIHDGVLVDRSNGMYVPRLKEAFSGDYGSDLSILAELAGWEVVARFTEKNIGVGFFPDYIMSSNRYPTIEKHPFQLPSFHYEICAIYKKGEQLSRAAKAFLDQLALEC